MNHIVGDSEERAAALAEQIFPHIASGNTILFLGAGASITEDKRYLSQHLIEYYEARAGFGFETDDIVEYVDVLSRNPKFSRRDFDDQAAQCLRQLKPASLHTTIARLPWKEIITTNYDLLIEQAHDSLRGTGDEEHQLYVVKDPRGYGYRPAADEVKYVKLNGCISDPSRYPLVFSTKDFERAKPFYKVVLQALENLSPKVQFLALGYSFRDPFAQMLLARFDRFNYRNRREMLMIDPHVQEVRLPALTEDGIRVIKSTGANFFAAYEAWERQADEAALRRRRAFFRSSDNAPIGIPSRLARRLADQVIQLGVSRSTHLPAEDFYRGEQPTFYVVEKGYDVIRQGLLDSLMRGLVDVLESEEIVLPILALEGGYGTGKSTLGYRLVHELLNSDRRAVAFEVRDPGRIRAADLKELLERVDADDVLFLFDECEVDSTYKSLVALQVELSTFQLSDLNVAFVVPIRENILQKFKGRRSFSNLNELRADAPLTLDEAADLLDKLDEAGIVHFPDVAQRNQKAREVVRKYDGDSFVALLALVTDGYHERTLRNAYDQLNPASQRAFLLTSLLYRYKLHMPASLLMRLVSSDWATFQREVIEVDSKGILIQDEKGIQGTDPDLYFRTRHSVLSEFLVRSLISNPDNQFKEYLKLVRKVHYNPYTSRLLIDLFRALRSDETFSDAKVEKLFDACAAEFSSDPHFNLHYAINLQHRRTEGALRKGIERLLLAEGYLERRNHRFTHRRAVLNYKLARLLRERGSAMEAIKPYVDDARELFSIKLIEDPFSSYSFIDYLRFEMWCLENVSKSNDERVTNMVRIQELFDKARYQLYEDLDKVASIEAEYRNRQGSLLSDAVQYDSFIEGLYEDPDLRPYALILRYHRSIEEEDAVATFDTIQELEGYTYLDEVAKLLFQFYGRSLHVLNHRIRLFDLVRSHEQVLIQDRVRYHYFQGVAEAYNHRFSDFYRHIEQIRNRFGSSLRMQDLWRDREGEPEVFQGRLFKSKGKKQVHVVELQRNFPLLKKGVRDKISFGRSSVYPIHLHFSILGIRAVVAQGESELQDSSIEEGAVIESIKSLD